jgi:hypothetical protein
LQSYFNHGMDISFSTEQTSIHKEDTRQTKNDTIPKVWSKTITPSKMTLYFTPIKPAKTMSKQISR